MKKIVAGLFLSNEFLLGFAFSFIIQFAYLLIANITKGIAYNVEGEILIPIGLFLVFVGLNIIIISVSFKLFLKDMGKFVIILSVIIFIVGGLLGVMLWEINYSSHHIFNILSFIK